MNLVSFDLFGKHSHIHTKADRYSSLGNAADSECRNEIRIIKQDFANAEKLF